MANFEYKNIDEILSTALPIRGNRISVDDNRLLEKVSDRFQPEPPDTKSNNFEFHTFLTNGAYISTIYNLQSWKINGDNLVLDVHRDMRRANNLPGVYKVVYNFLQNVVGGFDTSIKLFISDISPDRTELKLSLLNEDSVDGKRQIKDFVLSYLRPSDVIENYVLNFGENKISNIINVASEGSPNSLYVKLYEPLPADLDLFFECWIAKEYMRPYIETVNYIAEEIDAELFELKGPNFEVDYDYWITTETEYKSWNDILSSNVQTSQEILDRYISSSNLPVQLNVNYREFENFVFYSSAEDRVYNFFYKMQLVERYNSELSLLASYTGSTASNVLKVQNLRDKLISGFDNFEKWLYYETTSSNYYTSQSGSTVTPYPKFEVTGSDYNIATKEGKYKFYPVTSSQVENWYDNLILSASNYDLKNYNALNKAIPDHIREDKDNEQFTTFVNMIGQHFDIMYVYTDHIVKKNLREEHPKDGMSQDLIFEVAKNLGWTLSSGTQAKDLWEYALGVSGSGDPIWTGKTTTNKYLAKTEEERTKEVWRRILNNLPYIYKSKGTARGVKALLAAYGIPQTLLTIREYGGPDNADLGQIARAEFEKQTYYLNLKGSYPTPTTASYVSVPWDKVNNADLNWQYPDTLTFRWKMEPNKLYSYTLDPEQTLLQKNSGSRVDWFVTMNKNGTDVEKGTLTFYIGDGSTYKSASITDEYLYDDVPLNLMIRRSVSSDLTSTNQTYDLILKTSKYGKIAVERSASISVNGSTEPNFNRAWSSTGDLFIGSGSNAETDKILSGSIFEIRYWTNQLSTSSFDNHVLSPRSYNGNTETSSFYDLQAQFKFWQKFDVAVTTSISSSHPDQTKTDFFESPKIANFYGFTSQSFESIVETYRMEVPTLGNNTIYAEKVRIDSSSLYGGLDKDVRNEVSAFDSYSVDSDKLMIAFSPQHIINEDITEALGGVTLDDYIGAYSNISKQEYPELKWLANQYWQKYNNRNDFTAYIRLISIFDFSVFDQIRQTLPARSNPILGLVVEPNILERVKLDGTGRNFTGETGFSYESNELETPATSNATYNNLGSVSVNVIADSSQEGDIQDLSRDIDFSPEMPAVIERYVGNKNINRVTPIINYTAKSASIDEFGIEPKVEYHKKDAIVDQIKVEPKVEYTKRETSIDNVSIQPKIDYVKKEGSVTNENIVFKGINNALSSSIFGKEQKDYLKTNYLSKLARIQNEDNVIKFGGEFNTIVDFPEIDLNANTQYIRQNVSYESGSADVGYGVGWKISNNSLMKSTGVFLNISGSRYDNFYKSYYLYYTTSSVFTIRVVSSSSYVDASVQNQNTLATANRRQRFEGCKFSGPDINVNSEETLDGTPVVEVFLVDSKEINYRTYVDGGNLEIK